MVVGETKMSLHRRLWAYIGNAVHRKKVGKRLIPSEVWINRILHDGVRPEIRQLAVATDETWRVVERRFITIWRQRNPELLNKLKGGNGRAEGIIQVRCGKCGSIKRVTVSGHRYCRTCQSKYDNSARGRANKLAWVKSPAGRAYRNSAKVKSYTEKYNKDYQQALKLGLTIAKYRQQSPDQLRLHILRHRAEIARKAKKRVKVFCDKCGTRRKEYSQGKFGCPKCMRVRQTIYERSPKGRAAHFKSNHSISSRIRHTQYNHSTKGRACHRRWYLKQKAQETFRTLRSVA